MTASTFRTASSGSARQVGSAVLRAVPAGRVPAAVDHALRSDDPVHTVVVGIVLSHDVRHARGADKKAVQDVPTGVVLSDVGPDSVSDVHADAGVGYRFLADQIILLNTQNPQIASRLLTPLTKWKKYNPERRALMKSELERIMAEPHLSKDVFEVVSKSLA